jgi:hypothetical protein
LTAAAAAAAGPQALIKMGMGRRSLLASLAADGKAQTPAGAVKLMWSNVRDQVGQHHPRILTEL